MHAITKLPSIRSPMHTRLDICISTLHVYNKLLPLINISFFSLHTQTQFCIFPLLINARLVTNLPTSAACVAHSSRIFQRKAQTKHSLRFLSFENTIVEGPDRRFQTHPRKYWFLKLLSFAIVDFFF